MVDNGRLVDLSDMLFNDPHQKRSLRATGPHGQRANTLLGLAMNLLLCWQSAAQSTEI